MRDIGRISAEFENAKSLGDGAAEEWRKGLQTKGQGELNDASRWERWEASTPTGKNITQVLREYDVSSFPRNYTQGQPWPRGGLINGTPLPPAEMAYGKTVFHLISVNRALSFSRDSVTCWTSTISPLHHISGS